MGAEAIELLSASLATVSTWISFGSSFEGLDSEVSKLLRVATIVLVVPVALTFPNEGQYGRALGRIQSRCFATVLVLIAVHGVKHRGR